MSATSILEQAASSLLSGSIKVIDLTASLGPETPLIFLPPEIGRNTPPVKVHAISRYDQNGPFWSWNWIELGEHSGTHFDAPVHWITGRDYADGTTDTIPVKNFVAPANVIDISKEARVDPNFLLTPEFVKDWEAQHGRIEPGSWVLLRSDWYLRNHSTEAFLNADADGPHSPGPTAEAIRYIIAQGAIGWGTETVGTDAGSAATMDPPFPAHNLMHKANRYGLASLTNLDKLPPKGAVLIAAPLKFVNGTGSPVRALALVAR
jgi:isatin hydrolase